MRVRLRNSESFALVDPEDWTKVSAYKWDLHRKGYAYSRFWNGHGYTTVYMHRLVMESSLVEGLEVDHINHEGLDNRKLNLRSVTHAQNMARCRRGLAHTSRFRGVSRHTRDERWVAHIRLNGKSKYLGLFEREEDAAAVYNEAAKVSFGQFAVINAL